MHTTVKNSDGTFTIDGKFVTPIILDEIGEEFIYHIDKVEDLIRFTKFSDEISGINNTRTVNRYWRLAYDDCNWSDWYPLPLFESNDPSDSSGEDGLTDGYRAWNIPTL